MKKISYLILVTILVILFTSCDKNSNRKHTYEVMKDAVTDIDGNHYDAIKIGDQIWMMQNLKTTHYADGTEIPLPTTNPSNPGFETTEPYRWAPNDDSLHVGKFGWLYNWLAIVRNGNGSDRNPSGVQGICPNGWHVPSDAEWTELTDYVSSDKKMRCNHDDFAIAKSMSATTDWEYGYDKCDVGYDLSKNNATSFSALPAGIAGFSFPSFGKNCSFWTATYYGDNRAYIRQLMSENENVQRDSWLIQHDGLSVRCVKD